MALIFGVLLIAAGGVTFFIGRELGRSLLEIADLKKSSDLQTRALIALKKAIENDAKLLKFYERVSEADTVEALNALYKEAGDLGSK